MPWPTQSLWIEQCVASAKVRIGRGREVSIQLKHFPRLSSSIQTYDWSTTNVHFPIRFSDPRSTHVNSECAVQIGFIGSIRSNIGIAYNLAKSGQSAELPRQMCAKRQMNSQRAEKRILTSSQGGRRSFWWEVCNRKQALKSEP